MTLHSTPEQISWGIGALGMPGATACVRAVSLSVLHLSQAKANDCGPTCCLHVSCVFPDVFCSYGGLVDVLEVRGEARITSAA